MNSDDDVRQETGSTYGMTNDNTETLGDALGPGVTKDDLADTERVLKRFEAVAVEEFDGEEEWVQTAHRAVARALEHYDSELGETTQHVGDYDAMQCSGCGGYIGEAARIRGEYCDGCRRDDQEYVPCRTCGDRVPQSRATSVDVTPPDEYYPTFIYFCPTHAPPERPERTDAWDWATTRGNIDRHRDGRCGPVQMDAEDSGVAV